MSTKREPLTDYEKCLVAIQAIQWALMRHSQRYTTILSMDYKLRTEGHDDHLAFQNEGIAEIYPKLNEIAQTITNLLNEIDFVDQNDINLMEAHFEILNNDADDQMNKV